MQKYSSNTVINLEALTMKHEYLSCLLTYITIMILYS